jgi:Ribbon-helix-helix domain
MEKTTVYLPRALKNSLRRTARETGASEASLIRQAIERLTRDAEVPRPRLPLFSSGQRDLAERVDDLLKGDPTSPAFGER